MTKEQLRLHDYIDSSDSLHPGMSEYGLVVLKGKKNNSHSKLPGLETIPNRYCNASTTAWYGSTDGVREMTKDFNVWGGQLKLEDYQNPIVTLSDNRHAFAFAVDANKNLATPKDTSSHQEEICSGGSSSSLINSCGSNP